MMTVFTWFHGGGIFMYLILMVSIVAFAIIIYKAYFLFFKYSLAEDEVTKAIISNVEADNYSRAVQYCNAKSHPLTRILKAGLVRANQSEKEIRRSMEVAAVDEIPSIKKGTMALPQLSNLSTLLGLLGTISGLMEAFKGMEGENVVAKQEALSRGIAIAFRTTFLGLLIAVPVIVFYLILSGRQNKIISKIEYAATSLVDALVAKNKKLSGQR